MKFILIITSFFLATQSFADEKPYFYGHLSLGMNKIISTNFTLGPYFYTSLNLNKHKIGFAVSVEHPIYLEVENHWGWYELRLRESSEFKFASALFYRYHLFQKSGFLNLYVENWNEFRVREVFFNDGYTTEFDQKVLQLTNKISVGFNARFWKRWAMNFALGLSYTKRFAKDPLYQLNFADPGLDITKPGFFLIEGSMGIDVSFFKCKSRVR